MVQNKAKTYHDYITSAIVMSILPPFWWILYFLMEKKKNNIPKAYFFFGLSLLFAYLAPLYDVIHTIREVNYFTPSSIESVISMKTAVVSIFYAKIIFGCQSMNLYHLYFFITMFCVYKAYLRTTGTDKYSLAFTVCSMALVSLISLTFSTMCSAVCCFLISRNSMNIKQILLILVLSLLIHKSMLVLIFPSIFLAFFVGHGMNKSTISFLLVFTAIAVFTRVKLQDFIVPFLGFDSYASGYMSYKVEQYMGNGVWGTGYDLNDSLSKRLLMLLQYSYILFAFVLSIKYNKLIENKWLLSFFWVNIIVLLLTMQFYVIAERFCISAFIFSSMIVAKVMLDLKKEKKLRRTALALVMMYLLSIYQAFAPVYHTPLVGAKDTSNSITNKTLYMPTALLLDISDFGFNDGYIIKNNKE